MDAIAKEKIKGKYYEQAKQYFKCTVPANAYQICGHIGTLSDVLRHISVHTKFYLVRCPCTKELIEPCDFFQHNIPNKAEQCPAKKEHFLEHNYDNTMAVEHYRARNVYIMPSNKQEFEAFKRRHANAGSRPPSTPCYSDLPTPHGYSSRERNENRQTTNTQRLCSTPQPPAHYPTTSSTRKLSTDFQNVQNIPMPQTSQPYTSYHNSFPQNVRFDRSHPPIALNKEYAHLQKPSGTHYQGNQGNRSFGAYYPAYQGAGPPHTHFPAFPYAEPSRGRSPAFSNVDPLRALSREFSSADFPVARFPQHENSGMPGSRSSVFPNADPSNCRPAAWDENNSSTTPGRGMNPDYQRGVPCSLNRNNGISQARSISEEQATRAGSNNAPNVSGTFSTTPAENSLLSTAPEIDADIQQRNSYVARGDSSTATKDGCSSEPNMPQQSQEYQKGRRPQKRNASLARMPPVYSGPMTRSRTPAPSMQSTEGTQTSMSRNIIPETTPFHKTPVRCSRSLSRPVTPSTPLHQGASERQSRSRVPVSQCKRLEAETSILSTKIEKPEAMVQRRRSSVSYRSQSRGRSPLRVTALEDIHELEKARQKFRVENRSTVKAPSMNTNRMAALIADPKPPTRSSVTKTREERRNEKLKKQMEKFGSDEHGASCDLGFNRHSTPEEAASRPRPRYSPETSPPFRGRRRSPSNEERGSRDYRENDRNRNQRRSRVDDNKSNNRSHPYERR